MVLGALEKAKPNLPAKVVKTKAAAASVAKSVSADDDDSDGHYEDALDKPPAKSAAPAKAKGKSLEAHIKHLHAS